MTDVREDIHNNRSLPLKIGLVGPFPPPWGGMSVQAESLHGYLVREGFNVTPIRTNAPFRAPFGWLNNLPVFRAIFRFAQFIKTLLRETKKVDLVHIFSNSSLSFFLITAPAVVIGKWRFKRVIIHYHGGAAKAFLKRWGFLARPIFLRADCILVPSPFLERIFRQADLKAEVVPNIIDLSKFSFRQRGPIRPICIVTRHLEKIYNLRLVIHAFQEIVSAFPAAQLWIAGSGSERTALEKEVNRLGLSTAVSFLGHLNNESLLSVYEKADIFLNGSNIDNAPIAILEAFALGLPIVSTEAGGIPDMVEHNRTGLLVPCNDAHTMAEAVLCLLRDSEKSHALSQNGRKTAERYTWSVSKKLLLNAYIKRKE